MNERVAVEKVVARVYKETLKKTGTLPTAKETAAMEKKVKEAAEAADRMKTRR